MIGHFPIFLCLAPALIACLSGSGQKPPRDWTRFVLPGAKHHEGARDLVAVGNEVFAVGHEGLFYQSKDGKGTHVVSPTKQVLHVVWGTRPDEVYAAGDEGVVLRFDGKALQMVGEPIKVLDRGSGFTGHTKPRPTRVSLRYLWASSANDIYAAGKYACLLRFDGKKWKEVDIGAKQVWVRTSSRAGGTVLSRAFGPIWGTSASDVWVRKEVIQPGNLEDYLVNHVVMHFDGQKWRQTDVKVPLESVSNVGRTPIEPEVLAVSPKAIWRRFGGALWQWDSTKNDWRKEMPLAAQHWVTWTVSDAGSALALSGRFHQFTAKRWSERPELGNGYLHDAHVRKMVLTADGTVAAITYRDDDLHVWKK